MRFSKRSVHPIVVAVYYSGAMKPMMPMNMIEWITEMKSETGESIEKGRAEWMAGTIDGDWVAGDSVFFGSGIFGV
jgi:hypothetical protein